MNDTIGISSCTRGDDVISFLYGEANEAQISEFEKHLERCEGCRSELATFGQVRESITMWKQEALSASAPRVQFVVRKKSALAAIHEFFYLSPFWLKGAVGFAALALCVLVLMVLVPLLKRPDAVITSNSTGRYSEEDLKRAVAAAVKQQAETVASSNTQSQNHLKPSISVKEPKKQTVKPLNSSTRWARKSKPLSRSEREQLATDLRLVTTKDDDDLHLLGDRINQEF